MPALLLPVIMVFVKRKFIHISHHANEKSLNGVEVKKKIMENILRRVWEDGNIAAKEIGCDAHYFLSCYFNS